MQSRDSQTRNTLTRDSQTRDTQSRNTQTRNTRQRALILRAVRSRSDHPCADDIYGEVKKADPRVSRATVYRNLGVLCDRGEIARVKVPSADRFDLRCDRHYHFYCVRCGAVFDAPVDYMSRIDRMAEEGSGFKVLRHRTVFEGLCSDCLLKEGKK